jgi:hypothetical protein
MELTLVRVDARRHYTLIERADGVRFQVAGVGLRFAIPHDLAHLALEPPLRLRRGFWGSVAEGAVFPSMTHLVGRRKPHAEERSRRALKVNHDHIGEAEYLVALFNAALEAEAATGRAAEPALRAPLRGRWVPAGVTPRAIGDREIAAACAAWRRARALWDALPIGGTLRFAWPADAPGPLRGWPAAGTARPASPPGTRTTRAPRTPA